MGQSPSPQMCGWEIGVRSGYDGVGANTYAAAIAAWRSLKQQRSNAALGRVASRYLLLLTRWQGWQLLGRLR